MMEEPYDPSTIKPYEGQKMQPYDPSTIKGEGV